MQAVQEGDVSLDSSTGQLISTGDRHVSRPQRKGVAPLFLVSFFCSETALETPSLPFLSRKLSVFPVVVWRMNDPLSVLIQPVLPAVGR